MCLLQWEFDETSGDEEREVQQQLPLTRKSLTRGALQQRRAYILEDLEACSPGHPLGEQLQPEKQCIYPKTSSAG